MHVVDPYSMVLPRYIFGCIDLLLDHQYIRMTPNQEGFGSESSACGVRIVCLSKQCSHFIVYVLCWDTEGETVKRRYSLVR